MGIDVTPGSPQLVEVRGIEEIPRHVSPLRGYSPDPEEVRRVDDGIIQEDDFRPGIVACAVGLALGERVAVSLVVIGLAMHVVFGADRVLERQVVCGRVLLVGPAVTGNRVPVLIV